MRVTVKGLICLHAPLTCLYAPIYLWTPMAVVRAAVQAIVDGIARAGVDVGAFRVEAVSDDAALAELWRAACRRAGRSTLPLEVGLDMPLGAMGVIDYLGASSSTVGAAMTVVQQMLPLVAPGVQLKLERLKHFNWRIGIVNQPPFPGEVESDLLMVGVLTARLRTFSTSAIDFLRVDLTMPEPRASERALVVKRLSSAVRFGATRAALHIAANDWSVPLRTADPRLLATLRRGLGAEQRSNDALLVAVRALLASGLPVVRTVEDVATSLGHSVRSLQRRLHHSGTSFSALVDEARKDRAQGLFESAVLNVSEVALAVGFAEPASFTRAWRRWFNAPPSKQRMKR
jgi:AraC-like DNA-binding protein